MPGAYFHTVLVDANVLYSRTLRDWLAMMYLDREEELFRVCYTSDILAEVLYHLRKNHPDWSGAKIEKARMHIEETFGSENRVRDFAIDPHFAGDDPGDRHVHAAAVACGADILLTDNVADFPTGGAIADAIPYEVWASDDFFVLVDDSAPDLVRRVARDQFRYWSERRAEVDLLGSLRRAGAPRFADRVHRHLVELHYLLP